MRANRKVIDALNKKYGENKWTIEQKVDMMLSMPVNDTVSLKQARTDLCYLIDTYGYPQDYCGSFCNNDILQDILMGKITVKEAVVKNIKYYFENGIEISTDTCSSKYKPNKNDKTVQKIMKRYNIDF